MKGLIISAYGFEDTELLYPYYRLQEEGIEVDLASLSKGTIKGKHGYTVNVDVTIEEVNLSDYDFLILPGGKAPARLRKNEKALEITRGFFEGGKPVAAICHGPQILVSAGLMRGKKATSYKSVKKELVKAGADHVNKEVIVDNNLITSRIPADLPAFMRELFKKLKKK